MTEALLAGWGIVGCVVGAAHERVLWLSTTRLRQASADRPIRVVRFVGLQAAPILAVGVAAVVCGVAAALAVAGGLVLARAGAVHLIWRRGL